MQAMINGINWDIDQGNKCAYLIAKRLQQPDGTYTTTAHQVSGTRLTAEGVTLYARDSGNGGPHRWVIDEPYTGCKVVSGSSRKACLEAITSRMLSLTRDIVYEIQRDLVGDPQDARKSTGSHYLIAEAYRTGNYTKEA